MKSHAKQAFAICFTVSILSYYSIGYYYPIWNKEQGQERIANSEAENETEANVFSANITRIQETHNNVSLHQQRKNISKVSREVSNCSPARNLVFVKTHKTAGTSVRAMIDEHVGKLGQWTKIQKRFPIPFVGGYPGHFKAKYLIDDKSKLGQSQPNVISGHLRFNRTALQQVMPLGTRYITIIRDPAKVLYSSFQYYYGSVRHPNLHRKRVNCYNSPFLDLLGKFNIPFESYLKIAPLKLSKSVPWYFRSLNPQSHDLGLDPTRTDDGYIRTMLKELESSFDLIMIADYFAESLVLLRETLCMDWADLSTEIRNRGRHTDKQFSRKEMQSIRSLNKLDYALYTHFNQTLWRKIRSYGLDRMERDVKRIRKAFTADQRSRLEITEKSDRGMEFNGDENEEVSKYYKMDRSSKLIERLTAGTQLSADNRIIRELADYMKSNAGICNF